VRSLSEGFYSPVPVHRFVKFKVRGGGTDVVLHSCEGVVVYSVSPVGQFARDALVFFPSKQLSPRQVAILFGEVTGAIVRFDCAFSLFYRVEVGVPRPRSAVYSSVIFKTEYSKDGVFQFCLLLFVQASIR
jgi:hypothetical protein